MRNSLTEQYPWPIIGHCTGKIRAQLFPGRVHWAVGHPGPDVDCVRFEQFRACADDVASEHTAKMGDAFAGVARLRMANEGAAKANIQQAITEISAMQL
jgi:hypothetical protein